MILISIVVVPLLSRLMLTGQVGEISDRITALCILEQEAAIVKASPETVLPDKNRSIGAAHWKISTEISGNELKKYSMKAYKNDKVLGKIFFYLYESVSDNQ